MIKKIIVPTDYSEASLNALETAIVIAENNDATIQILHVTDTAPGIAEIFPLEVARAICDAMAGKILINHHIRCEIIFSQGVTGPTIVKTAFEKKADLIVMGAHGASGPRDLFIGSNAYFVIKTAACPVLIIPEYGKWIDFNKIVFPFKPTPGAIEQCRIIKHLTRGKIRTPVLELLGISSHHPDKEAPQLAAFTSHLQKTFHYDDIRMSISAHSSKNIAEQVLAKATIAHADLLVVSSDIDGDHRHAFIGPFSQQIINHAKIPVLSMPRSSNN